MAEDIESKRVKNAPLIKPALNVLNKALKQAADDYKKDKSVGCTHFLGYLKTRPKKSSIPDECLTCNRMLKCI
ncbi:hypothetical protein GWO13_06090 [Candidatus Bathyarchaeota archaeon]|nr:hypothetical protein [Candidatus Bathyarchaeota archaeon]